MLPVTLSLFGPRTVIGEQCDETADENSDELETLNHNGKIIKDDTTEYNEGQHSTQGVMQIA